MRSYQLQIPLLLTLRALHHYIPVLALQQRQRPAQEGVQHLITLGLGLGPLVYPFSFTMCLRISYLNVKQSLSLILIKKST